MPVPTVRPMLSQSMPSTSPLKIPVMAFTASVIFPPRLSQLINSFAFVNAPLMPSAINRPMPSKSAAAHISLSLLTKSVMPLPISCVS